MPELRAGRLLGVVVLVDLALAGLFALGLYQFPDTLASLVPGQTGKGLDTAFTGNYVFASLLLLVTALLFLGGGLRALGPVVTGLRIFDGMPQEQRHYLKGAARISFLGMLLLIAAFASLCLTVAHADPEGVPLFVQAAGPLANSVLALPTVVNFTLDQLAGALLLDIPEVYRWQIASVQYNPEASRLLLAVVLFRAVVGFTALALLLGRLRRRGLRRAETMAAESVPGPRDVEVPWSFSEESARDVPRDLAGDLAPAIAIDDDDVEAERPMASALPLRTAPATPVAVMKPVVERKPESRTVVPATGLEPVHTTFITPLVLEPLPDLQPAAPPAAANDETIELSEMEQIDDLPPNHEAPKAQAAWEDHRDAMLSAIRRLPRD